MSNQYDPSYRVERTSGRFMHRVFGWQAIGLLLSAGVATLVASSETLIRIFLTNRFLMYGLMFAQVGVVIALVAMLHKMSYRTAVMTYLGYATLVGITLSTIFFVYTMSSIGLCFGVASAMFGLMAIYGYSTKADLTGFGSIMTMGLFGIVIASLINLFMQNDTFNYVISYLAVIIFTGLTAYDVQKIKHYAQQVGSDEESLNKVAIFGALTLYLDFLNIFLHLLQLLGNRRR